jgi:hypothetical protein
MRHFRPYIAWIMLIAIFAIALPRTWVHDCNNGYDEHESHGDAGNYDQIDHEICALCDYAPASSFAPAQVIALAAPLEFGFTATPLNSLLSSAQVENCSLRGPPIA